MKKLLLLLTCLFVFFASSSFAQTLPMSNGSFENWHAYQVSDGHSGTLSLHAPDGWYGSDSLVSTLVTLIAAFGDTTVHPQKQIYEAGNPYAHEGQKSALLVSAQLGDSLGMQPGILANSPISFDTTALLLALSNNTATGFEDVLNFLTFKGGEPIAGPVESVTAWLRAADSAVEKDYKVIAIAQEQSGDSFHVVGRGELTIPHASIDSFTEITVNLQYQGIGANPNRLVVVFFSHDPADTSSWSSNNTTMANGLYVDQVSYTLGRAGIATPQLKEGSLMVYPNPARDKVCFKLDADLNPSDFELSIYDLNGRLLKQNQIQEHQQFFDGSSWAKGSYFYRLKNKNTGAEQGGKFILY